MNTKLDAFAAWLQERESHYAEQALRLMGTVSFEQERREASAKSRAFEEALEYLWLLQGPPARPKTLWQKLFR